MSTAHAIASDQTSRDEVDPTNAVAAAVAKARAAMEAYENHDQQRVDEAVTALAWSIYKPEHARMLAEIGKEPLLSLGLRLGEGSGAAVAINIVKSALACHSGMATFAEAGVSAG